MRYPHTIRLRGPWECEPLANVSALQANAAPAARRVQVPCPWTGATGGTADGGLRFSRRFHRPANLDPHERLWLVLERAASRGRVIVNGEPLAEVDLSARANEFAITDRLRDANLLSLELWRVPAATAAQAHSREVAADEESPPSLAVGEVRLEVRSWCFLRHLTSAADHTNAARRQVTFEVAGEAAASELEIVIESDGQELAHTPTAVGQRESLALTAPRGGKLDIRLLAIGVELWHAEVPL